MTNHEYGTSQRSVAARGRLRSGTEAQLPETQAWRRAVTRLGVRPTQYRCAAESLLRRLRRGGARPRVHPVVDLCNDASVYFAIPVAGLDTARVTTGIEVGYAAGTEHSVPLGGETEHPEPGEVSFLDAAGRVHARLWTNRQSGHLVVRPDTREVLTAAEALHGFARDRDHEDRYRTVTFSSCVPLLQQLCV
ncbi:phenylalanine--tRNA ligase beta subunit-related protein [Lipingzhangella sp. LS1_29]|uniref:Phenylalanine--tRNA ligase beta subunit-related protein n=1 Tax=Lipingzhangella rawalii TaxID=2055835 RepID=A0ABU2H911_9ACTN|nr:phenylalanine--tRNA ligase beta subunit-related protein [Lipingzhangella rawalii]MDS1271793.1 phenylalanine--tRNA ligase beta subunit-related protein [Lipingzhangella rawalii]